MKVRECVQILGNSNGRCPPYTPSLRGHYLEAAILLCSRFNPVICDIRAMWPRAHGSNHPRVHIRFEHRVNVRSAPDGDLCTPIRKGVK